MSSSSSPLVLPFFPCSSALLVNSVPRYVPFLHVLSGCSSCVSKLSRVIFTFTGTSLREPGHDMDGLTIENSRSEVDRWLHKGFRSCGKSAAMTPAGAKNGHGGHNVPEALQGYKYSAFVVDCNSGVWAFLLRAFGPNMSRPIAGIQPFFASLRSDLEHMCVTRDMVIKVFHHTICIVLITIIDPFCASLINEVSYFIKEESSRMQYSFSLLYI